MIIDLTLSMKLIQSQLSCFQVNNAVDAIVVGKIVRQRAAKRRVTLICLTIAISFTITTLPYQIIVYAVIFADKQATTVKLVTPLRTVGTLNACISPVIFGLMWRPFQQSLMKVSLKPSIDTILDYERLQLMF
jgi:ABC-type sugar transport system permease subunit